MSYFDADPADNMALYSLFPGPDSWYDLSKPLGILFATAVGGSIHG